MAEKSKQDVLRNNFLVSNLFMDIDDLCRAQIEQTLYGKCNCTNTDQAAQENKFKNYQDTITMYRKRNENKFCREEKSLLNKISSINSKVEYLQGNKRNVEAMLQEVMSQFSQQEHQAQSLQQQKTLLKSEQNMIAILEKNKKGFEMVLTAYYQALGVEITLDTCTSGRYILTFVYARGKNYDKRSKVAITRLNDGFSVSGGQYLDKSNVMQYLLQERTQWLSD